MLFSSGPWVLSLMTIYIDLVVPSISAHCTLRQHHGEHYPYSLSGQSGKSTLQCQLQSMCCLVWQIHHLQQLFRAIHCTIHCLPVFPTKAHTEKIIATCYHMLYGGQWLPPSVEPQALLPAGYPVDYTNCTADPVHDANCLAAHTVC